jgi:uncharacterized protein YbaA (DUF1428 family)
MAYVEFMVSPVKTKRMAEYKKLCRKSNELWKKHGAVSSIELIADDAKPGKLTSFPQSVMLAKGEAVAVSMITFKSKSHRNAVWKKLMTEPFFADYDWKRSPFDGKRMFFGCFKTLVQF